MRRVVNGVTYNTDTATLIATTDYDQSETAGPRGELALYHTRGGAFFLHDHEVIAYRDRHGDVQERERDAVEPMTREEAHQWVMQNNVELHDERVFGEPPEAAAEQAPEATIYARVPVSLKNRVEAQAKAESLSVNSFVIRCLERCAAGSADRIATPVGRNGLLDAAFASRNPLLENTLLGTGLAAAALNPLLHPATELPAEPTINKLLRP